MTFLSFWALWFLFLVPVAVGLYLLRLKRKRRDISTLIFWQQVMRDEQSTKLFQKLRQILSLLLQIAFIVLVVLALARPILKRVLSEPTSRILVIDTTASMQVKEGKQTRFELARNAARRWIAQSSFREETMILAAGREPRVACPFSSDEKALLESLGKIKPTDAAGNLINAVEDAKKILQGKTGVRQIIVLSDQAVPQHFKEDLQKTIDVEEELFGSSRENVGILGFSSRPLLTSPDTYEILFQVKNFGSKPVDAELEFKLDDTLIDAKPIKLRAGETKTEVYPAMPSKGGLLKVVLKHQDDFPVDNEAFTVLPDLKQQRVLLLTRGNLFLQQVLQANALVELVVRLPSEFNESMAKEFSVVVVDASAGGMALGVDQMPRSLWIGSVPGVRSEGEIEHPLVSEFDEESPLNRLVSLRNITLGKAKKFSPLNIEQKYPGWSLSFPVRVFDDPLVVAARENDRRWVAWTFDVLDSDLPLRVAFPLMISNSLQWLAPEMGAITPNFAAGDVISLAEGETTADGKSRFFVPEKAGFHQVRTPAGSRWVAVNLFDSGESEIKGATAQAAPHASRVFGNLVRPIWFYLALIAAALLLAEWWLWNRRIVA